MNQEYMPIPVTTLRGEQKIDFNVYLKVGDNMVLYVQRGDSFEGVRLTRLKDKNMTKLFVRRDESRAYQNYIKSNREQAYDAKSSLSLQSRTEIVQGEQQTKAYRVFRNSASREAYVDAKQGAAQFVNFLVNNREAALVLLAIPNIQQDLIQHGVSVATLSLELARHLGHKESPLMNMMALGAFLHDFGHSAPRFVYPKDLDKISPTDRRYFYAHCKRGATLLHDKSHFDQTVINIIMQHEECMDGSGYPQGYKEKQMDPSALIVGAANALDRIISLQQVPANLAAKRLMVEGLGKYPLNYLKFLADFINKVK